MAGKHTRSRLALGMLVGGLVALLATLVLSLPPSARAGSPSRYGADYTKFVSGVKAWWPQSRYNFCGVATIAAIAAYRGYGASQDAIGQYLDSPAAESAWGTPPGHAFLANISGDFGTDPRALAQGLVGMARGNYSQFVGYDGNWDATLHLVSDLYSSKQPISVIVDHGAHSVVISAVYATGNPVTDPASITSLEMWDPAYGSGFTSIGYGQVSYVTMQDWLTNVSFWGVPYDANNEPGAGDLDPDPSVGPYTYDPSKGEKGHLWIGHYVYFRPYARGGVT
ncbi:MAG: hypothetical protein IVW57_18170, partial [Ktedonobacterales bacterium]|nr:hypothetical protein [Ktedonobacterales bacterium]